MYLKQQINSIVHIIGGGLAGSEAAWQIANANIPVILHEMRPKVKTFAHQTHHLAEMVCSNSFRSDDSQASAVGELFTNCDWRVELILEDFAGIPRIVIATPAVS